MQQAQAQTPSASRPRRILFAVVLLLAVAAIVAGVKLGDPETIYRFSAQI